MFLKPALILFVGGEIVENDMELAIPKSGDDAIHEAEELDTTAALGMRGNAVKYGALSVPTGRVNVRWSIGRDDRPGMFVLSWDEMGGPTVVPPTRTGFGRKIIEDTVRRIGHYQIEYAPSGLKFSMEAPIDKVGWVIEDKPAP